MDIFVKLTIPNYIYKFYDNAARHIAGCNAEDIMADALSAYAGLLSDDIAKERERTMSETMPGSDTV